MDFSNQATLWNMVRLKSIYVHYSNGNTLAPLKSRFKPNPKLLVANVFVEEVGKIEDLFKLC